MIELVRVLEEIIVNLTPGPETPMGKQVLTFKEEMMLASATQALENFNKNIPKIVGVGWESRDKEICHVLPKPNRHHNILHYCIDNNLVDEYSSKDKSRHLGDSGFIVYLNRQQAYELAEYNKQLKRTTGQKGTLYSEDLW